MHAVSELLHAHRHLARNFTITYVVYVLNYILFAGLSMLKRVKSNIRR